MKSLNRTLSLVLVLVMVFGLFGAASATSFKDDTTIQYKEAVDVMTGIGAINGYTDGTFAPKGTITREEAAKLVTYAVLGADVAKTLSVSATGFKDVEATRWSAPFITYLVSKGIINGLGDGNFNPTGNVTGFELAKMLLAATGYGKQGEFTGASWSLNVAVLANSKGIFTDSKATSFGSAATREEAALYCFNAITKVVIVKYSKDNEAYSPVEVDKTIGTNTYGLLTAEGIVLSNNSTNPTLYTSTKAPLTVISKNTSTYDDTDAVTFVYKSDISLIGHAVKVYYHVVSGAKVAYAFADKATKVVSYTVAASDSTGITVPHLTAAGFYATAALTNGAIKVDYDGSYATGAVAYATPGVVLTLISNNDSKTVNAVVDATGAKVLSKVTAYTAPTATTDGSITVTSLTSAGIFGVTAAITIPDLSDTISASPISLYSGIAKNDYVYVTKVGSAIPVLAKADVLTAVSITAYGAAGITVNGKVYQAATANAYNFADDGVVALSDFGLTAVSTSQVGTTPYNVVLTSAGAIAGIYNYDPTVAANSYAVILSAGATGYVAPSVTNGFVGTPATAKVFLALADGTKVTYDLPLSDTAKASGVGLADGAPVLAQYNTDNTLLSSLAAGTVVKYAVSGTTISLLSNADNETHIATALTKGSTIVTGDTSYYLTDATKFIYWDKTNTSGANAFSVVPFTGYTAIKSTGAVAGGNIVVVHGSGTAANQAVFVYVNLAATTSTSTLAYIPGVTVETGAIPATTRYDTTLGANVYDYTAYVDGVKTTLTAKTVITATNGGATCEDTNNEVAAPFVAKYTVTNGYVTAVDYIAAGTAANTFVAAGATGISSVASTTLAIGTTEYTYANAKVITVANDATKTVGVGSVSAVDGSLFDVYVVIKTAASGATPADLAYIYVVAK